MEREMATFEEIFRQNERRIHYYIHRLNIQDPHQEFYQEGLVAMWNAYENYEPDKGTMATYFNYMIRNRIIDLMRKQNKETEKTAQYAYEHRVHIDKGNYYRNQNWNYPIVRQEADHEECDAAFWQKVKGQLSDNQWKWVTEHIIEGKPLKEIAEQEGVTAEAVKSWGKGARRKLRGVAVSTEECRDRQFIS
ncbi:sigma-70 family RNA polymerase sigma factor [Lentibacillus sp. CBA3610]|uniref:sigma-70 family RNA polymerase sigma factor n=1 Tax=Lentibacillus sp. CBA3610 TaxID=2518176 RepID=UPI0015956BB2|nr:sigma-70 family RNA polymerase sigma factor [Lentibacillus sp. CBA3610]QKY69714.1 sigma-70 family RNA polymerase sigma factor [Lentibacillus sp. CBA3610]